MESSDTNECSERNEYHVEISPGLTEYYVPFCEMNYKPFEGKKFTSLEEGIKFYRNYASKCGFDVRLGSGKKFRDNTIMLKTVYCNREGEKLVAPLVYPKVKVRVQREEDDIYAYEKSSLESLKAFDWLSLHHRYQQKEDSFGGDPKNVRPSSAPRPRVVLLSPDNDGIIGSKTPARTKLFSGLKDHPSSQNRHTRCKISPKSSGSESFITPTQGYHKESVEPKNETRAKGRSAIGDLSIRARHHKKIAPSSHPPPSAGDPLNADGRSPSGIPEFLLEALRDDSMSLYKRALSIVPARIPPRRYKTFVSRCIMKGDMQIGTVREVNVKSGLPATASKDRLELLDDEKHIFSMRIVGGSPPQDSLSPNNPTCDNPSSTADSVEHWVGAAFQDLG
ncbi:abscisic acid receptor pyl8 [Phtheirospermum japonicum]|uniref:Abscisic acid receptor pyl8 n=1 Tax=Phtheirospermum japonicum TaxID=374723 RepID=A0A830BDQ8_9LAMI|nr:abscisic acid receptor pyl8 [Phtheirospermum japonicum]